MARLFIFAIGGTGARVLKSLTMLLAAGVVPQGSEREYEIVPILIDPHKDNLDVKRAETAMRWYQAITDEAGIKNGFFGTKITTLDKLGDGKNPYNLSPTFTFELQEIDKRFSEYIGYNTMDEENKAFADLLFSGETRNRDGEKTPLIDVDMEIGFIGNPNIGSIVLNQMKDSKEFKAVADQCGKDDRIFIISSIFGGTGAAGFPVLLKNIRNALNNSDLGNKNTLKNMNVGGLSVLPYFNIANEENSPVKKSTFITKTKSALHYYKDNITGNNSINALYYIADDFSGKPYQNDPGHGGQQNDAHFVEVASALAIIDFMEISDASLDASSKFKEFGIKEDQADISLINLGDSTQARLNAPLTQFYFLTRYIDEHIKSGIIDATWTKETPVMHAGFLTSPFYKNLENLSILKITGALLNCSY